MVRWWSVRLWGAHLLALVCVCVATGMGLWQYDAWQQRRAAERVDLTQADPVPMSDVLGPDDPFPTAGLGRPVEVRGSFLEEGSVLVSGRDGEDGSEGYWLVTPLSVGAPGSPAVPVVRGWVREGSTLAEQPEPPTGEVDVVGWLQPPESTGSATRDAEDGDTGDTSDGVVPALRVADLIQLLAPDQDLYGAYVVAQETLPSDAEAGVEAASLDQLPPASRFTGLRNILYAIEWWVFAAFAAFIWWRYVRDTTAKRPEPGPETEPAGEDAVPSKP